MEAALCPSINIDTASRLNSSVKVRRLRAGHLQLLGGTPKIRCCSVLEIGATSEASSCQGDVSDVAYPKSIDGVGLFAFQEEIRAVSQRMPRLGGPGLEGLGLNGH